MITTGGSTATVNSGSISFYDGSVSPGTLIGTQNVNSSGTASITTSSLSQGAHNLIAVYNGNANFNNSPQANFTETILALSTVSVSPIAGATYNQTLNYNVTVSGSTGTPTGSITVIDTFNSVSPIWGPSRP